MMIPKRPRFLRVGALFSLLALGVVGCSEWGEELPALVEVTGTVTLDGQPLNGAVLVFSPEEADAKGRGRASMGSTDEQGHFTLMYSADTSGAVPGKHKVSISKSAEGGSDAPEEETLDSKYNTDTELTARVLGGRPNAFEFALQKSE